MAPGASLGRSKNKFKNLSRALGAVPSELVMRLTFKNVTKDYIDDIPTPHAYHKGKPRVQYLEAELKPSLFSWVLWFFALAYVFLTLWFLTPQFSRPLNILYSFFMMLLLSLWLPIIFRGRILSIVYNLFKIKPSRLISISSPNFLIQQDTHPNPMANIAINILTFYKIDIAERRNWNLIQQLCKSKFGKIKSYFNFFKHPANQAPEPEKYFIKDSKVLLEIEDVKALQEVVFIYHEMRTWHSWVFFLLKAIADLLVVQLLLFLFFVERYVNGYLICSYFKVWIAIVSLLMSALTIFKLWLELRRMQTMQERIKDSFLRYSVRLINEIFFSDDFPNEFQTRIESRDRIADSLMLFQFFCVGLATYIGILKN